MHALQPYQIWTMLFIVLIGVVEIFGLKHILKGALDTFKRRWRLLIAFCILGLVLDIPIIEIPYPTSRWLRILLVIGLTWLGAALDVLIIDRILTPLFRKLSFTKRGAS